MNCKNKKALNFEAVLDWTFPTRYISKDKQYDYIVFSAKDPATGKLRRKKYSLRKWKRGIERDTMASQMIANLLNRLQNKWNPFIPDLEDRSGTLLTEVIAEFKEAVEVEVKKKIKSEKTKVDYFSRIKMFQQWADDHGIVLIKHCTSGVIDHYLQANLIKKNNSPRTRNNNRTFLSAFFGWCVKRHFLDNNPCCEIENVRENPKKRIPLSDNDMIRLKKYLTEKDKHYLLAVMFQYYTLIRPKELSHLRLRDISVKEQTVTVPGDISKNRREEPVALNDKIIKLMIDLNVFSYPDNYYLFGKDFHPSREYANERIFRDRWVVIRKELSMPSNIKFYSLKDTGIIDLLNAEGAINARDQARHTDISVTNLYTKNGGKKVHEETKHFDGRL